MTSLLQSSCSFHQTNDPAPSAGKGTEDVAGGAASAGVPAASPVGASVADELSG
jgi:hypothetical protein